LTRIQCSHTDVAFFPIACDDTIHFNDRPEFDLVFTPATKKDNVNHPDHYNQGDIECIDAIRAALTPEEYRGFCKGNAFKYIWRERQKGGNTSLEKAEVYLNYIKQMSAE